MEGFYTKDQAARILGVSTRQVDNYLKDSKLRRVLEERRAWIPKEDVDKLYRDKKLKLVPTMEEITTLQQQMAQLQRQVKILQRGLGFGGSGEPRSDIEIRLLYQSVMDDLGAEGWPIRRVMEFTEELSSVREEDMAGLLRLRGPHALLPFFDLARRMVIYVESHDQYTSAGMQAVRDRLIQARRILLALLEINMKIETPLLSDAVRELYRTLSEQSDPVSNHIGAYIARMRV
jgi:hypothetical protein